MAIPTGNILKQLKGGSLRNNLGVVKKLSGLFKERGDKRLTAREIEKNIRTINKADKELTADKITSTNQRLTSTDRRTIKKVFSAYGADNDSDIKKPGQFVYTGRKNILPTTMNNGGHAKTSISKPAGTTTFHTRGDAVTHETAGKQSGSGTGVSISQIIKSKQQNTKDEGMTPTLPTLPENNKD